MTEWKEYKLGEVCTELSDGLHKAPVFKEGGEYIFVNAKNIANGYIVDNDPTKKSTYDEFLKYSSPLNDTTILYSIDGTIGNIAIYRGEKCILGKGACYMNPNPKILNRMYLYYELQSPRFKAYIDQMSTGSTIQHISLKTMRNYVFTCPSLSEQKSIASILSSLDDKIDLLHRENATLELMAETLFSKVAKRIGLNPMYEFTVYYRKKEALDEVMRYLKDRRMTVQRLEIHALTGEDAGRYVADINVSGNANPQQLLESIFQKPDIIDAQYRDSENR